MVAPETMLRRFREYSRHCETGVITPSEFVNLLFDHFADDPSRLTHLAPEVFALVPEAARSLFGVRVREALRPEFRFPAWKLGGGRPRTEEEERQESELLTGRVRAWAAEFERLSSLRNDAV